MSAEQQKLPISELNTFLIKERPNYQALAALKTHANIYIYIYIYIVLFGPVKQELGVIPSRQENYSKPEHLNFPGNRMEINL